ncbi:cytochrome c biogenesis protein CcsA [Anaerolineales bacterium]
MTTVKLEKQDSFYAANPMPMGLKILSGLAIIGGFFTLYMGLAYAGTDITQGNVQRLFYIHMPSFFGAFIAFALTVIGGIQYLRTRKSKWDTLALAGVEIGLMMALINITTGAIWARPIWNTWWTWDPRLTSDAIMILTYAAYLMLRAGIENSDRKRTFSSVYGIFAYLTVLITLFIIRIRPDTIHPVVIGESPQNAQGTFEASTGVAMALLPALLYWSIILPAALVWIRIRLQNKLDYAHEKKIEVLTNS